VAGKVVESGFMNTVDEGRLLARGLRERSCNSNLFESWLDFGDFKETKASLMVSESAGRVHEAVVKAE